MKSTGRHIYHKENKRSSSQVPVLHFKHCIFHRQGNKDKIWHFMIPLQCSADLQPSRMLCGASWWLVTNLSALLLGQTSNLCHVTSQNSKGLDIKLNCYSFLCYSLQRSVKYLYGFGPYSSSADKWSASHCSGLFHPRPVHVRFVTDRVAMGLVSLQILWFPSLYHSTILNTHHSFIISVLQF